MRTRIKTKSIVFGIALLFGISIGTGIFGESGEKTLPTAHGKQIFMHMNESDTRCHDAYGPRQPCLMPQRCNWGDDANEDRNTQKALVLGKGWSVTEVVSTESTGNCYTPSVVVDNENTVHIAWSDRSDYGGSGYDEDIYYKKKPVNSSWTTTEVVSTESSDHSYNPSLAVDASGTLHLAWYDGTDYGGCGSDWDIFYKQKPSGGSWTTTEVVSTESTEYSAYPSLSVDAAGSVHITWFDETNYGGSGSDQDIFYKQKPSGGSWTTTEVVSTESTGLSWNPSLSVDSAGTIHVAWEDGTNYGGSGSDPDVFYKRKPSGGSWTTTEVVSTESTGLSWNPSLSVDSAGTVHVAWADRTYYSGSGEDEDIFYKQKPSGGSWTTTEVVSTESTAFSSNPSSSVDYEGTVHVTWDDLTEYGGSGSDRDIFYKQKPSGGSWIAVEVVSTESTSLSKYPTSFVDSKGVLHVAWEDGTEYGGSGTDYDIFYKYRENFPPNTPGKPTGPTDGKTGRMYNYSVVTTDPDDDEVYYWFDWGDNSPGNWLGPYPSGHTITATHVWSDQGVYAIQVKAKDAYGAESPLSDPLNVTIKGPALSIGKIVGGIGVSTVVKNNGTAEATKVSWDITLDGTLIFIGKSSGGVETSIAEGTQTSIKTGFVFGIGKTTIKVSATCDEGKTAEKTASAFVLGPFVLHVS